MRVAIQGERGSNSHLAVTALLGPKTTLVPCALSAEVFERLVEKREAEAAVLPIENSLHGAVADHSDLLLEHEVAIVGEVALRIRHALMAVPGVAMAEVRRVLSHPVALSQCRGFFRAHAAMQAVPFYDTAGAVKHVMQTGERDVAAIAAPGAAAEYGAMILERDLEDDPQNFTRFLLLAGLETAESVRAACMLSLADAPGAVEEKISVAFRIPHRPGSLVRVLGQMAAAGADLTRIESRPVPGRPWEYVFFADLRLVGGAAPERVLEDLGRECLTIKVLGQYRAAAVG